jgi:hypothetical protein
MTNAHIDVGVGVIQLNINGQKERFGFRPKDEKCSQIKSFNRKESVKELEKQYNPSNYTLIEFMENLRTREEIKVYNQRNAKRNIQRKNFLEFGKKEIQKVRQKKASPSTSPSSDDDRTQGMDSLAQDEKLEPLP